MTCMEGMRVSEAGMVPVISLLFMFQLSRAEGALKSAGSGPVKLQPSMIRYARLSGRSQSEGMLPPRGFHDRHSSVRPARAGWAGGRGGRVGQARGRGQSGESRRGRAPGQPPWARLRGGG